MKVIGVLFLTSCVLTSYSAASPAYLLVDRKSEQTHEVEIINQYESEVCETTECINAASRIMSSMDATADPCNDFYRYTCGGWIKRNPIPDDKNFFTQFSLAGNSNADKLKTILKMNSPQDREAVKKAKMFYRSCMNEEAIEELGAEPALDLIKEFGALPLFQDKYDKSSFSLEKNLARTKNRIIEEYAEISSPLINMDVVIDDRNSSNYVIMLDQPMLSMSGRENYLNEIFKSKRIEFRQSTIDFLEKLWKAMDKEKNITTFDAELLRQGVDEILRLETDLAKILELKYQRQEALATYNKMTIEEMSSQISDEFDWFEFISQVMAKVDIEVEPTTQIVIHGKPYLTKLPSVLADFESRVLKNYIIVYNLLKHVEHLPRNFRVKKVPNRTSVSRESLRWQVCVGKVKNLLKEPIGALYIDNFYPQKTKKVATEMIMNVVAAFKKELEDIQWMDDETKQAAHVKVDAVSKQIGSPDYIVVDKDPGLNMKYKDLVIHEDQYFKNIQNLYNFQLNQSLRKLSKPVDRNSWGTIGAADVTAFYDRFLNTMIFPAAVMNPPFFDPNQPYAMNYGAIGNAMGHEFTHGFDQRGSTYDATGNLRNWWTNFSRNNFEEKTECLKKQYSSFYYEPAEMFVNGNQTIGENIADNGGIRSSYYGYQLWKNANPGLEFQLPGLQHYTSEQLFFIAYGQVWCSNDQPEVAKSLLTQSIYAPNTFRTEGPLKNLDKFAEAFNCRIGEDSMSPIKSDTCRVW